MSERWFRGKQKEYSNNNYFSKVHGGCVQGKFGKPVKPVYKCSII